MTKIRYIFVVLLSVFFVLNSSATEMIVTTEVPASHWKTKFIQLFADKVKERTNGEVAVKIFPAGQLYNDRDALMSLGTGAVHMVWPMSSHLEALDPQTGIINIPFALSDEMMLNPRFAREMSELISASLAKRNISMLGLLRTSDAILVFKDKQVRSPQDVKGLKIRVPGGRALRDALSALGANPISMPASEMATAVAQGVIDGVATSPAGWRTILGDTAKQATNIPGMLITTYAVCLDKNWLEMLPAPQRKVIEESLADVAAIQWKGAIDEEAEEIKQKTSSGGVYWKASPIEIDQWRNSMKSTITAFERKYPEISDKYNALVTKYGK